MSRKEQNHSKLPKAQFPVGATSGCDTVAGIVTYRKQSVLLHVIIVAFV
jgi:hypothetical protein